jgi:hypothetical protein
VKLDYQSRVLPWAALAASVLAAFGMWYWAEKIAAPAHTAQALALGRPIGNNSDLYPRWLGARELLLHGRDPYSPALTREIQTGFYGRPLNPRNPSDPSDQVGFAYPLYVVFLLAPTLTLPFRTVMEIFRWLLLCSVACSVPLWIYAIRFRPKGLFVVSGMVLAVATFPAVQEFHMQNLTALVVLMLAATAAAMVRGWLALAGFLLALSTIKPQISAAFILFFMLWGIAQWAERQPLVWSFLASLTALVLAADEVLPGWIGRFLRAIREYHQYADDPSILQALLPVWLARLVAGVLVAALILYCWRWRKATAGSEHFGWALAWVGTVTLTVIPKLAAYNQPLLIPALLVLLAHRKTIFKAGVLPRALSKGVAACLLWEWGTAAILAVSSLVVGTSSLQVAAGVPEDTLLALPPLTLLAVAAATASLAVARPRTRAAGSPTPQTLAARHE